MEETTVQQQPPQDTHPCYKTKIKKILRWLWAVMSTKAGQKDRVMGEILVKSVRVSLLKNN